MTAGLLLDEHMPPAFERLLARHAEGISIRAIGQPGVPPKSTPDPDILRWCEQHDFMLVTNNRKSMPGHLAAHLRDGGHIPGVLIIAPHRPVRATTEALLLIAGAAMEHEFRDCITFLPVP